MEECTMANVFHNGKEYKAVSRKAVVGDLIQITGDTFSHDPHGLEPGTIDTVSSLKKRSEMDGDFVVLMAEASWGEILPDRVRLEDTMTNATHDDYVVLEEVDSDDDIKVDRRNTVGVDEIPVEWIGRKALVLKDNPSSSPLKKGDIVDIIPAPGFFAFLGLETMVQLEGDERPYTVFAGAIELLDESGTVELKAGDMVRLLQDDTDWRSFQAGDEVELFEQDGHIVFEDADGDTRLLEAFKYERI
jgi:hypothetical protein